MIIQWFGQSYFRIDTKNKVIALDPYHENFTGLKPPRFKADILLISHNHDDHNNQDLILGKPFVMAGAGEIEVANIVIDGLMSYHDNQGGKLRGLNTIYLIRSEDMKLVFLGDLGEKRIKEETLEKVANSDILFIPVGGTYTIDAEEAVSVINQIEPKIVIPMHYQLPGLKIKLDSVDNFIRVFGKKPEYLNKLVMRRSQLPQNTQLVILQASTSINEENNLK